MGLYLSFSLVSGFCWTVVYIEGIRIGIKDKSYAIPFWALALNLAWELLYTVQLYADTGMVAQTYVNATWLVLDLGILYTFLRYGYRYFPATLPTHYFYIWTLLGVITAMLLQWLFFLEFGLGPGSKYSAFLQNLLMSILFIVMLVQRGNDDGQSLLIAIPKWIGTLAPTILYGLLSKQPSYFVLLVGLMISVFDIIYILMLIRIRKFNRQVY